MRAIRFCSTAPARVGLLGGSFNPAHSGHLHISQLALDILGLDAVWWLVSPQNPLKSGAGMEPLASRVAGARGTVDGLAGRVRQLHEARDDDVERLDQDRERHREIQVALGHVELHALGHQRGAE